MKNALLFLAFILLLTSCKDSENTDPDAKVYSQIKKADWLVGRWDDNDVQSDFWEHWERANDSTLVGEAFLVVEYDTIFSDSMAIYEKSGGLFLSKSTRYKNKKYVDFGLTSSADGRLVFENPKNNFPTKITFRKVVRDSILITNSGIRNGEEFSEEYSFRKNNSFAKKN